MAPPSKKQKTLGHFGFTKTVKHRGIMTKVEIPDEPMESRKTLTCEHCGKNLKNQQGLSTHLLTHGVKASKSIPPRTSATLTEELEQDIIKDVVENLVKQVECKVKKNNTGKFKRKSYSSSQKADIIHELLLTESSQVEIGEKYGISQSLLSRWLKKKENIFLDAADSHKKLYRKRRPTTKYIALHQKLWQAFTKARSMGHRVNFHWLKSRATTIQRELTNNKDAEIGKHVITSFLRRRNIRMRTKQRSKKKSKEDKIKPLQQWHATFRERCLRTGTEERYHPKWGRFLPSERLNVDQSPLPFVIDSKKTYEYIDFRQGHHHNTWISQPGM